MATMDVEEVLLDTNVLLTASVPKRRGYEASQAILNEWPNQGVRLCTSPQIMREYLAVATRPSEVNGLGLSQQAAHRNVSAFVERMRVLDEDRAVLDVLLHLLGTVDCTGKQVHDANLVAVMLRHGVSLLITCDSEHFHRFEDRIRIAPLTHRRI